MPRLDEVAEHLDSMLRTREIPDYPLAINGVQLANEGEIRGVAAAVDCSMRTIRGAIDAGANLLVLHHGLFWSGLQPIRGPLYRRLTALLRHDIAVYASHLPLDAHPEVGNNVLLARALGLAPSDGFATFQSVQVGVQGTSDLPTAELQRRAAAFARRYRTDLRASAFAPERRTRRWAICTGAGASADTLREAIRDGVDTLIVGEGPHWTAVDADELGLVILYAGHYATETLGVQAVAENVGTRFGLPWTFVDAPTGL